MQDGDVLLVTGGSRGIGAAAARLAAAAGYRVALNYRADGDAAAALVAEIEDAGGSALALQADVSREQDVDRLFAELDARYGRIDALVNSAGVGGNQSAVAAFHARHGGGGGTPADLERVAVEYLRRARYRPSVVEYD